MIYLLILYRCAPSYNAH